MRKPNKINQFPPDFFRIAKYALLSFLWLLAIATLVGGFLLVKPHLSLLAFQSVRAEEEQDTKETNIDENNETTPPTETLFNLNNETTSFIPPPESPASQGGDSGASIASESLRETPTGEAVGWQLVKPVQAVEPAQAMDWLVFEKVYEKLKGDNNIYMAELDVPQVAGHYTLQTEVQLAEGGSKLYDLQATVSSRGYVYLQTAEGKTALADVKITLYSFNNRTNQFAIWSAGIYDQVNPQTTNSKGEYLFLAPAGRYYLTAEKKNYEFYQSPEFTFSQPGPISDAISLSKKRGWFNWLK